MLSPSNAVVCRYIAFIIVASQICIYNNPARLAFDERKSYLRFLFCLLLLGGWISVDCFPDKALNVGLIVGDELEMKGHLLLLLHRQTINGIETEMGEQQVDAAELL